jgi:hypothetical protein
MSWVDRTLNRLLMPLCMDEFMWLMTRQSFERLKRYDHATRAALPCGATDVPWYVAHYLSWHNKKFRFLSNGGPSMASLSKSISEVGTKLSWK